MLRELYDAVAGWTDGVSGPEATLIAALGVLLVGGSTIAQKIRNDKRDQWWKRAQWAIDLTLQPDEASQAAGLAALELLARRGTATRRDREMLVVIVDEILIAYFAEDDQTRAGDDGAPDAVDDRGCESQDGPLEEVQEQHDR